MTVIKRDLKIHYALSEQGKNVTDIIFSLTNKKEKTNTYVTNQDGMKRLLELGVMQFPALVADGKIAHQLHQWQ